MVNHIWQMFFVKYPLKNYLTYLKEFGQKFSPTPYGMITKLLYQVRACFFLSTLRYADCESWVKPIQYWKGCQLYSKPEQFVELQFLNDEIDVKSLSNMFRSSHFGHFWQRSYEITKILHNLSLHLFCKARWARREKRE